MSENFDVKECEELLLHEKPSLRFSYQAVFAKQASNEELSESKRKAYGLLADLCGMWFRPNDDKNPLEPVFRLSDGRTSFSIDHLSEEDLLFLESIVDTFRIARLRARLADVLWLRRFHEPHLFALQAINAYLETPLSSDNWRKEEIDDQWMRGTILACQIGKKNEVFHGKTIPEYLLEQVQTDSSQDTPYLLFLSRLLLRLRISDEHYRTVLEALDRAAQERHASREFEMERQVLEESKKWTKDIPPLDSRIAASFAAEIQLLIPKLTGQHLRARLLCSQLIFALRNIPGKRRAEFQVQERLATAHELLTRCREQATEDMHAVKSQAIDISEAVRQTVDEFSQLDFSDALTHFALIPSCKEEECRSEALSTIKNHALTSFFPSQTLSPDGRVVAQTGGWIENPKNEEEIRHNNAVLEDKTVFIYRIRIELMLQAYLLPAFSTILDKHRFSLGDAVAIVRQSPLIPPDRILAFERMLELGFHGELSTATYIMVPEIENLIRFHLKGFGVQTTTLEDSGIERELGLNALMENPEVSEFLGRDLAWELKMLFCNPSGPNLRNNFAHGLETATLGRSGFAFYAWWLVFKMILLLRPIEKNSPTE